MAAEWSNSPDALVLLCFWSDTPGCFIGDSPFFLSFFLFVLGNPEKGERSGKQQESNINWGRGSGTDDFAGLT